jgi:DinB family protein
MQLRSFAVRLQHRDLRMSNPETRLRTTLSAAMPRLAAISDEAASKPRAPGKWSRKEIVGHLIDSASNNHQRFVRAQFTDELVCSTYDQDAWVRAQRYRDAPWNELVSLWALLNLHLARVMAAIPDPIRNTPRTRHNLDQVAFRTYAASEPVTLELFMYDYVVHLEHHLSQILQPTDTR